MTKMFFGGVPTAMDVRRLNEAFPDLEEGDEISHSDIEALLELDHKSSRYRTVTSAWRRAMLNDHNIEIGAVAGAGFRCLTPGERVSGGIKGVKIGTRKQMRSVRRVMFVRTDDPILCRKQEVLQRFGIAVSAQASTMMKEIEPPKPTQRLPRLPRGGTSAAD